MFQKLLIILNANMFTLEELLNRQIPDIDNSNTSPGPHTVHAGYSHIRGFEDSGEFNYKGFQASLMIKILLDWKQKLG